MGDAESESVTLKGCRASEARRVSRVIFARETPYPAYLTTDTRISHPRYPRRGRTMSHLPGINFPCMRNRIS